MPAAGNLDPATMKRTFDRLNEPFKGITWELEDLVGEDLFDLFLESYPTALVRSIEVGGAVHRELTRDGKSRLIRFCNDNADLSSLGSVLDAIHALRFYMNLSPMQI